MGPANGQRQIPMSLIIIGGHSRSVGKTSVVAGLIAALREHRWTAAKSRNTVMASAPPTANRVTVRTMITAGQFPKSTTAQESPIHPVFLEPEPSAHYGFEPSRDALRKRCPHFVASL